MSVQSEDHTAIDVAPAPWTPSEKASGRRADLSDRSRSVGAADGRGVLLRAITWIWRPSIPVALSVLAVAQIGVHLVFFLHLTTAPTM